MKLQPPFAKLPQLGPELVRFLWAIANHAAHNHVPVPRLIVPVRASLPQQHGL